ncbi:hypothetical protein H0H93_004764 [Arthromyces matolae]|nr:hypothetical protein H0H93_004764 [Arthromyces matolae]
MAFSRKEHLGRTVQQVLRSAPLSRGSRSSMTFKLQSRRGLFGITRTISSSATQYCDGLRGPFVVYDPFDPHRPEYDIDDGMHAPLHTYGIPRLTFGITDHTVITLADWYHFSALQAPAIPKPNSTLINGMGRYPGGPASPLAVLSVNKGLRYRFRLISISCDPNFIFSIDGHNMANQAVGNYWVRAQPNLGQDTSFAGGINSAILRYRTAPNKEPTTTQKRSENPLIETNLHPLTNPAAPGIPRVGAADVTKNFNIALTNGLFTINGASFVPPTVPVLLQILSGAKTAQSLLPSGSVFTLPRNAVVELTIPGGSIGAPVQRDVVSTGSSTSDNVTIRFRTDNPGPWIFHCHIDWHLDHGLAVVFAEDDPDVSNLHPPCETLVPFYTDRPLIQFLASWDALCPAFDAANPDQ